METEAIAREVVRVCVGNEDEPEVEEVVRILQRVGFYYRDRCREREARIAELEAEDEAHYRLIEMQQRRMRPAEEMWRRAHPDMEDVLPDLGELIEFLLARIAELEAAGKLCQIELAYLIEQTRSRPGGSVDRAYKAICTTLARSSGMVAVKREIVETAVRDLKDALDAEENEHELPLPVTIGVMNTILNWLTAKLREDDNGED